MSNNQEFIFCSSEFVSHLGTDGNLYATNKKTQELFVYVYDEWMTFDEFISLGFSSNDSTQDEDF